MGTDRRSGRHRPARPATDPLFPVRLLALAALATLLIPVPVPMPGLGPEPATGGGNTPTVTDEGPTLLSDRSLAAVVAGTEAGFVLDREGEVLRVNGSGEVRTTAELGRRSTPFGTVVGDRVVFGGVACERTGCADRVARLTVLDAAGDPVSSVDVVRTSDGPAALDGFALAGTAGGTVWVYGGGTLFQVAVPASGRRSPEVVAEAPWPGGEPCVIDGVLHNLTATGGTLGRSGTAIPSTARFDLTLRRWDASRWRPVPGGTTSMPFGQNAHCSPTGYEIRDGHGVRSRWSPAHAWRDVAPDPIPGPDSAGSPWVTPVTTSNRTRYALFPDGRLAHVTHPGPGGVHRTGTVVPAVATSEIPPALQVDDSGGRLFWCATTYRSGVGTTRCGLGDVGDLGDVGTATDAFWHLRASTGAGPQMPERGDVPGPGPGVHHYNVCSAACGDGVRPHSRDIVTWFAARERPVALSLNELCYDDSVHLSSHLPADLAAGAGFVALGSATGCPGVVRQFGNQVRVRPPRSGPGADPGAEPAWWATFPTQLEEDRCVRQVRECRGLACAATAPGGDPGTSDQVVCSAHLESARRSPDTARAQADEYRDLVDRHVPPTATRVLAGDFNLDGVETDAVLARRDTAHVSYARAETGPTIGAHRTASGAIDFVYISGPTATAEPTGAVGTLAAASGTTGTTGPTGTTWCDRQASDHCHVTARAGPRPQDGTEVG